ncbi:MAG: hypothetical protein ABIP54_01970 [Candidatus Andersenbacteria bacterium]
MDQHLSQSTGDGAMVDYRHGVVFSGGSYEVSAYLMGNTIVSESITVDAGQFVNAGDYVVIGVLGTRKWVDRVLPKSLYSKAVIDYNEGKLYWGNGTSAPNNVVDLTDLSTGGGGGSGSRAFSFFSG